MNISYHLQLVGINFYFHIPWVIVYTHAYMFT